MKNKLSNCKICGKPFITITPNQRCCSPECSKENGKIQRREKQKEYRKEARMCAQSTVRKAKDTRSILDIQANASALGISYGEYIAREYIKEMSYGQRRSG